MKFSVEREKRILVVEDDPADRKTLADILKLKGYEPVTAVTGAEAIMAAERGMFANALIDLMLTDMSGLEVMARIKTVSPSTESIILTGNATVESAIEATKQGAFSYLCKPYQMDDLLGKIREGIERQQEHEINSSQNSFSGSRKDAKILIVDDDPNIRRTLSDILRLKGFKAVTAANGAEAIAAAEQEIFNLALIDIMLPDMPGLDVMSRIKTISQATEAIIQSGHASVDSVIEATRRGAFAYVLKPYQIDDLLKKIREGIERQRAKEEMIRLASFPRLHPNPVIELNADGEVTYANPAADKLFPGLRSKGMSHILLNDGAGDIIAALRQGERKEEASHEVKVGDETFELHISYIREVDLIRVYMLSVTDRISASKKVNELSLIAEHTKDVVIITDREGLITWVNQPFHDLTGYSFGEAVGKKPGVLLQGPDTDPAAIQALRTAIAEAKHLNIEIVNYSKQKQSYWLEINLYPIRDNAGKLVKFIAVERDISKRKKADEEIRLHRDHLKELVEGKTQEIKHQMAQYREQKNLLNLVLESMPLALFVKDAKNGFKWVIVNNAAESMFGVSKDKILGHEDYDIFPKSESDFFRATDQKVMAGGVLVEIDVEPLTTPEGTRKLHTIKVPIYDELGAPALLLGIAEDVTEKITTREDLRIAKELAEQATHAKSDFLANMSHEIRTPMNGIIGLTRLLADTELDLEQSQSVQAILKSGETLLFLLNDILDFSKIEARELALESLSVNLQEILQNVIDLLSVTASKKGLVINYSYGKNTPPGVVGDPVRIGQIVTNLIGNAVKFTQNGHVSLSVSAQERKDRGDFLYSLIIEDTGIGMSQEVQAKIFWKFTQSDSSTSRQFGGTGLGLAISKSLVEMMGGEISVASELGKGSIFTVTIPFQKAEAVAQQDNRTRTRERRISTAEAFSRFRILVVDDHPVNMLFAQKLLKTMGFVRTDSAEDGLEALDKLKNGGKDYDIVLMDCQMPGMDGFEASRNLREWEQASGHKRTPVIAMTARAMEGDRDLCLQAGMDDYLSKPVNPDKLHEVLSRWLIVAGNVPDRIREKESALAASPQGEIINLPHLELFTEGDLDQEKMLADVFLKGGAESIEVLKAHQGVTDENDSWMHAAHRLKGSSAQIGAHSLFKLCLKAEQEFDATPDEKKNMLADIEKMFAVVKDFFQHRQL